MCYSGIGYLQKIDDVNIHTQYCMICFCHKTVIMYDPPKKYANK